MDFLGNVVNNNMNVRTTAEKQLRPVLCDENIQILSSFELNSVASLTWNDLTCDGIFEFVQTVCTKPMEYTPLTIQKALIVTKHIVIYGSEKTVNHAYGLRGSIQPLLEFNTVLMTQQQGGAKSFFQSLQGGAVDKGGPVREAAGQLLSLLANVNELRAIRLKSASEDSLVPIGNNGEVAFVTDEARRKILQRKMAEENRIRIQSNLKKSEDGFGGGYASKDGRAVVGAAHGIEEMIKMANRNTTKFTDDGRPKPKSKEELILEELKAEADAEKAERASEAARLAAVSNPPTADLLGSFAPAPMAAASGGGFDLLDFGGSSTVKNAGHTGVVATGDLLGGGMPPANTASSADPFGLAQAYNYNQQPAADAAPNNLAATSLLDFTVQNDPFEPVAAAPNPAFGGVDTMGLMGMTVGNTNATNANNPMMSMMSTATATAPPMEQQQQIPDPTGTMNDLASGLTSISLSGSTMEPMASAIPPKPPIMGSNVDRFSALDALAAATPAPPTAQDARDAEARLLGFAPPSPPSHTPAPMGAGSSDYSSPPPTMMSMGMAPPPPVPEPIVASGSGKVATAYGGNDDDDGDNPWVMGGSAGMGLEPVGPQPSAPPPPPPAY